jgi:hypothetical protein
MTLKKCLCLFTSAFPVEVSFICSVAVKPRTLFLLIHSPRENVWNAYAFWGNRLVTGVLFTLLEGRGRGMKDVEKTAKRERNDQK